MKKLTMLLLLGTLSIGMMTGCGSSADEEESVSVETSEEASTEEASTEETSGEENTSTQADISGDWVLSLIQTADGTQYTLEEYCAEQGVDSQGMEATYSFDGNGTVTGAIGGVGVEGTYTFDGTSIELTFAGNTATVQYSAEQDAIIAADENSGMYSLMTRQ